MPGDQRGGHRVGKYESLTRVSVGGMAELFLAALPGPGGFRKFVALKQMLPDVRDSDDFVKMFLDEARITAALSHPNIGQVFDLGRDEDSGELYLAMEFIAGQDLVQLLRAAARRGTTVPLPIACRIVHDVCLGLHAAHHFVDPAGLAHPVIHRDVSPKNVMLAYSGHVKVIDFGIAKAKGRLVRTQSGQVRGTLAYMSPEQLADQPLEGRSDLFAVAVMFHELLTSRRLYKGDTSSVAQIMSAAPPPPSSLEPSVPAALDEVVLRGLEKLPEHRFATGRDFARAIEQAGPRLARDEDVADYLADLFAAQLKASRELFALAQRGQSTGEELSVQARALTLPEPAPAVSRRASAPTVPSVRVDRATEPSTPAARDLVPRWQALALTGGVLLALVALGGALLESGEELPAPPPPSAVLLPTPPPEASLRQQAREALARSEWSAARDLAAGALQSDPRDVLALRLSGVAVRHLGQHDLAVAQLDEALRAPRGTFDPADVASAEFELACGLSALGRTADAARHLERALFNDVPLSAALAEPTLAPVRAEKTFFDLLQRLETLQPGLLARTPGAQALLDAAARTPEGLAAVTKAFEAKLKEATTATKKCFERWPPSKKGVASVRVELGADGALKSVKLRTDGSSSVLQGCVESAHRGLQLAAMKARVVSYDVPYEDVDASSISDWKPPGARRK